LALAEKWLSQMGKRVSRTTAVAPTGATVPGLHVQHGTISVFILPALGGTDAITVFGVLEIPPDVRARLGRESKETQARLHQGLRYLLMLGDRTGFTILPPTATLIADVTRFSLEEILRLDEADSGSFNRLADAVQEVVNGIVRALAVFLPPGKSAGTDVPGWEADGLRMFG
jgi:hypothetical protein